uniref:Uncharacterized protein n=1 Tax=Molossus molossus TaxID=27622 RepID=A0A7J8GLP2_MOLMO|nr:hypothetical protein HJG59_011513 [Molossus molossus]
MFPSVGQVSLTMEGRSRPDVSEATWGSGDPGLGQGGIPAPKLPSLYRPPILKRPGHSPTIPKQPSLGKKVRFVNCDLAHGADVQWARPDDLEPEEAEPRAPAQEAEPAVVHPREPDAGTDPEGCPVPETLPPPAAAAAAAPEPGLPIRRWAASLDLAQAPPPLAEGPWLGPARVPASEEGLPVHISSGPAPEQLAETARHRPAGKLVSPPFVDLLLLLFAIFAFWAAPWRDSVIYFFVFIFRGIFGSFTCSLLFFLLLCFLSP